MARDRSRAASTEAQAVAGDVLSNALVLGAPYWSGVCGQFSVVLASQCGQFHLAPFARLQLQHLEKTAVNEPAKKKPGRPPLPQKRSARLNLRTYPDVADKVARNGNLWLERVIRRAKDADQCNPHHAELSGRSQVNGPA